MIDNTFASCLNQKPFDAGVDIVMESATKYLGGHSDILAGVVVEHANDHRQDKSNGEISRRLRRPFYGIPAVQKLKDVRTSCSAAE